uniref:Uncharacterized protein n=1 Tax=Faxonius propinquus nudivirus TaxID=3139431 RepID=A0AAU8GBF7_9VIRU
MVHIINAVLTPQYLLFGIPELIDFLVIEYLKLDIWSKTKIKKIYNLKYNLHFCVVPSISYEYDTHIPKSIYSTITIPEFSNISCKLEAEASFIRKYSIYKILEKPKIEKRSSEEFDVSSKKICH